MKLRDPTHQKVLSVIKERPVGRLLDAGAGKGQLSAELKKQGFEVYSCDIEPSVFNGIKVKKVDMNKKLPYKKSFFDYIIAIEVIEHLEGPFRITRGWNRILKKGVKST